MSEFRTKKLKQGYEDFMNEEFILIDGSKVLTKEILDYKNSKTRDRMILKPNTECHACKKETWCRCGRGSEVIGDGSELIFSCVGHRYIDRFFNAELCFKNYHIPVITDNRLYHCCGDDICREKILENNI